MCLISAKNENKKISCKCTFKLFIDQLVDLLLSDFMKKTAQLRIHHKHIMLYWERAQHILPTYMIEEENLKDYV